MKSEDKGEEGSENLQKIVRDLWMVPFLHFVRLRHYSS